MPAAGIGSAGGARSWSPRPREVIFEGGDRLVLVAAIIVAFLVLEVLSGRFGS